MKPLDKALGRRLTELRKSTDASQKAFAALVGCSFRAWQDYELGLTVPGGNVLLGLARQGANVNWLLTGEGPMRIVDLKPVEESNLDEKTLVVSVTLALLDRERLSNEALLQIAAQVNAEVARRLRS